MDSDFGVYPDERLLELAAAGDAKAFTELVGRYKGKVLGWVARYGDNHHDIDDLAQEVFIKMYRNMGQFRGEAPFAHWLARIATHTCLDFLRQRRQRAKPVPLDEVAAGLKDQSEEDRWEAGLAHQFLNVALSHLRPEERLVITLLTLEEKSVREVAALIGWTETRVKVKAFRARRALKKIVERYL